MVQGYDKMQVGYIFLSRLLSISLIGLLSSKKRFLYYYLIKLSTSKYIQ